jgi:pilus assembly protein CpaE
VVDCADVRSAVDSGFASAADAILVVTTNEIAALHATKRSLEYLEEAVPGRERVRLIVNRYTPATGLKREELRAALEVEPFAVLSNDYELIQTALLEGKPAAAGSRFRTNVHALVRELSGPAPARVKGGGWLRRLGLAPAH